MNHLISIQKTFITAEDSKGFRNYVPSVPEKGLGAETKYIFFLFCTLAHTDFFFFFFLWLLLAKLMDTSQKQSNLAMYK